MTTAPHFDQAPPVKTSASVVVAMLVVHDFKDAAHLARARVAGGATVTHLTRPAGATMRHIC